LLLLFFFLFFTTAALQAQTTDTLAATQNDSLLAVQHAADSALLSHYVQLAGHSSSFFTTVNKPVVFDVQQMASSKTNATVFFVLALLLVLLTYVKTAFEKDMEELMQSFINRNIAMQLFRTQSDGLTISSVILHINFILVMSMFVRFALVHYYSITSLENISSILFLVFLFTFFYLAKLIVVKILGVVFEVTDISSEYIYHFTIACKTLGLALLPALFVFYMAPSHFFNFVFIVCIVFVLVFLIVFVLRGLSTGYKLMYRSVYHFFIYVCVVEISPIFLLFKLLTKTVV
jgi:hypothetical protein